MRTFLTVLGVAVVALVAVLVFNRSDNRYSAKIELLDAGGLRKGANVRLDGAPVGTVSDLVLDKNDHALATIRLDPSVAPIGSGARVLIQADGFFGERYVELNRGNLADKQPSGSLIPIARSSVSPRLDDLVDSLDTDTRGALQTFFNEQGTALVGRGQDLANVLASLPPGLMQTGELLRQFSLDNAALGRLVDESDQVVASVAGQREQLGRMITAAAGTFDALDSRRPQLGATLREAPSTLRSARRVLVSLQDAAVPLAPAARGLRTTAPTLTRTLTALPGFAEAAVPAFGVAQRVSPMLTRLGTQATPVVQELRPMARTLTRYTRRGLDPLTDLLDRAAPNLIGVLEGWARSTQGYDNASQIFRFGATSGTDTFAALLGGLPSDQPARKRRPGGPDQPPAVALPAVPKLPGLSVLPPGTLDKLEQLLKDAPAQALDNLKQGKPDKAVSDLLDSADGAAQKPLLDKLLGP